MRVCGLDGCGIDISSKQATAKYCCRSHNYLTNKSFVQAQQRAYYLTNRERYLAYAREYRTANPESCAAWKHNWAAANPEARKANVKKHFRLRRARLAGAVDSVPVQEKDWLRLVRRYGGRCAYCGVKPLVLTRDHVVPVSRGGRHSIGNLLPACQPCNDSKNSRFLSDWRRGKRLYSDGHSVASGSC